MSRASDLALLRRFEPIIRYTRGEEFFPMNVAHYVDTCNLWVKRSGKNEPVCVVSREALTLETLSEPRLEEFGSVFFLKFADPLTLAELASYKIQASLSRSKFKGVREASRQVRTVTDTFSTYQSSTATLDLSKLIENDSKADFHAGRGRLARVGYFSRFLHALYLFSLLARGRVPGDAARAAALTYKTIMAQAEEYCYYGRVVHENGWIVLQYWFFYAFNDWRTGFYGFNDHEADWEMICIYLSETPSGDMLPEWVAYAAHDFSGDDLRRRWDDPELEKVGEHPVIYTGAGSHASYYTAGEYLVELEVPLLTPFARLFGQAQNLLREKMGLYYNNDIPAKDEKSATIFHLPFVDYARGDGVSIGPGQEKCWGEPAIINEPPLWVSQYRGLWGMYIQDPLAGENAPAGPMYRRNGAVRRVWYDSLGWAGLDKIPTAFQSVERLREQHETLAARQIELTQLIDKQSHILTGLGIEAAAMQNHPHLEKIYEAHQQRIKELSDGISQQRAEYAENQAILEAFSLHAQQLWQGERGDARAHIRRAPRPIPEAELQIGRVLETWAAISIGLILISLVGVIFLAPQNWFIGIIAIVALFLVIEATFRRRLTRAVNQITIGLAVFAALLLLLDYFPHVAVVCALVAGGYMTWQNLRELWS